MTHTGENRARYARERGHIDPRPSRFANEGIDYRAWAERADAWAEAQTRAALREMVGVFRMDMARGYPVLSRTRVVELWRTTGVPFRLSDDWTAVKRMRRVLRLLEAVTA